MTEGLTGISLSGGSLRPNDIQKFDQTILYNVNDCTFFFVNICAFVVQKGLTTKTQRRHEEEKVSYCRVVV